MKNNTHSIFIGYCLWIFGFTGAHRFYYGKQLTGLLWFCTGGLFLIGWLVDVFLIPSMDRHADLKYVEGPYNYSIAWLLLTFLGAFGAHRLYMGKWVSGLFYLLVSLSALSFGLIVYVLGFLPLLLVFIGLIWDFWTLNGQLSELNQRWR